MQELHAMVAVEPRRRVRPVQHMRPGPWTITPTRRHFTAKRSVHDAWPNVRTVASARQADYIVRLVTRQWNLNRYGNWTL